MALLAIRYSLFASLKSVLVSHAQMVAVIEPHQLDEPDDLRADRDHGGLQMERLAARRHQDGTADPDHRQAGDVDGDDGQQAALAHTDPPAHIEMDEQIFGAGIREQHRAKDAYEQHANHNTAPWHGYDPRYYPVAVGTSSGHGPVRQCAAGIVALLQ